MAIEFIHGNHDAILEFLFGCDADVAQHRAREFGEEALDEIEPGAVRGREGDRARSTRPAGSGRELEIASNAATSSSPIANSITRRHPVITLILVAESSRQATC